MFVLLLVYVDDIVITGSSTSMVELVIASINDKFKLKDLGSHNYFLGIEVTTGDDYLIRNQKKYVQDLISNVGLSNANPFPTPITCTCITHTSTDTCTKMFYDESLYRSTIGALQHICIIRPNIHFSVNKLS